MRLSTAYTATLVKKRYNVASILIKKNACTSCFLNTPASSYFFNCAELRNFLTNPGSYYNVTKE